VPIAKMQLLPVATMRRMFCEFCPQAPLYICPIHLPSFLTSFILQNGKCYKVFSHLDAIFSVIFMRDPIGQNYEKYFVKQKFETCQTKTENRMK
jgi:hypothetical protein